MFSTSSDILNLVLAICVLALSFFLCWAIYYFIVSIQKFYRITRRVEKITQDVEETVTNLKGKLTGGASSVLMFTEFAKHAMDFIKERRASRAEKKETRRAGKKK
ncbi:MAG: hypothetical protein NTX66_00975 [Candidatus Falkowbacteria bacterium]|nr:hypothetical protein [Candidatus Falkowbacteria bacterium]